MNSAKVRQEVRRSPRNAAHSGFGLDCEECGPCRLTLSEFRKQLSCKPNQIWHCPKCGSVAKFREMHAHG